MEVGFGCALASGLVSGLMCVGGRFERGVRVVGREGIPFYPTKYGQRDMCSPLRGSDASMVVPVFVSAAPSSEELNVSAADRFKSPRSALPCAPTSVRPVGVAVRVYMREMAR